MPRKALVAFWVVFGCALLVLSPPAWCSETNVMAEAIDRSADTVPDIPIEKSGKSTVALPVLTLDAVWELTLARSPMLSALSLEIEAREFEARQAGLRPNPELSIAVENVAGRGDFSGTDRAETTLRISQRVELAGKRERRQEVGRLDHELAEREYDIAKSKVLSAATERFVAVLAAQKRLAIAGEQVELAGKVMHTVEDRIAAGKTAAIERVRLQILVAEARLRQNKAAQELTAARQALVSVWGGETVDFTSAQGSFEEVQPVPDWSELAARLVRSPEAALHNSAARRANHALALEQANRIPDLTFSLGAKNDQDSGDNAFVAELSVPLPIFDRNQNTLAAARARKAQADDEAKSAQLQLRTGLAEVWRTLHEAYSEVDVLRREILPATRQTFDAVAYGYQAGKYGFLEVLDAERTLCEAKNRYVDVLTAYHRAVAELERLLGEKIFVGGGLAAATAKERGQS